ncbi:uncharacterized protein LOC128716129 [Anopheles marshallii]|uniref:uncharacterized protein LOC128716129 n=1 Tax=Anopheles marshallii TaxID=1521116 RepID=UPI00237A3354|nr:uncharacterized protein LOC128716129 [Anopheles marshallii]
MGKNRSKTCQKNLQVDISPVAAGWGQNSDTKLFVNRWIVSLLVALVVLDGGVQAYRYYRRMGNRFQPVMMKPMPVGRFGFVRAENPNADGAMDAKSGEESSETAAPAMDGMQGHEMHAPEMREMIHESPHPVEIDMGPGMQARIMGFAGELDGEGNFGRAAEGAEEEEEEGAQFRHFKHKKHKKHKHVIHTHHHYHHKKEGHGGGYGHHGYGKHDSYGHHGHGGGHHGYGHGGGHGHHGGDDDDYEPTYGHHGRYRRSSMSEMSHPEGQTPDAQALDRTALTHSSPELPIPMEASPADPSTPTVYRQSVSRRQLVRSKNERLAQIGRDRAQRANRLRSMTKRMIEGLEGGRTGRMTGEEDGAAGEGSVPQRGWLQRRRTKSEWRRRDLNTGRRRRPIEVEQVIERRTPEEPVLPLLTPPVLTPELPVVSERGNMEEEQEPIEARYDEPECDDPIGSNFYVDEQQLTTTSTTPRAPEHRLEEELEPRLVPFGNELDQEASLEVPLDTFVAQQREEAKSKPSSNRNSLWRGLSKRLSAFRERQADRSERRKMVKQPEPPTTTTADPNDEEGYDSNEIVEYYQQDVGRVLYRMANGRLLEEPQRLHLRRSAEGDEDSDTPQRKRRLNRLSNRTHRRRKPAKHNSLPEPKTPETSNDAGKPVINIGTFRLADTYDGGAAAALENTGAARTVSGTGPSDMDSYILQKVREYCSTSCASGKSAAPVIIVPEKPSYHVAYAPAAVAAAANEPIVGSSKQLIVQPPSTYEAATTSAPKSANPPACPTKIVKCIPKALASGSKRSRKTDPSNDQQAEDKESNPLVSLARGSMTP